MDRGLKHAALWLGGCLAAAAGLQGATVTGDLRDVTGAPVAVNPMFIPQSTPLASGSYTILDVPREALTTNGVFSLTVKGGLYKVTFGPFSKSFVILVPPDDTNTYSLNYCAALATNLPTFSFTNTLGAISERVLPGANLTAQTNFPGQANEHIILHASGGATNRPISGLVVPGQGILAATNHAGAEEEQLTLSAAHSSQWLHGPGAPTPDLGQDTDYYLETSEARVWRRDEGAWSLKADLNGASAVSAGTYILSGARVAWVSGYTYRVTAATYFINSVRCESAEQEITLDAADATYDRVDVLALGTNGALAKFTGTPASNPAAPTVDASEFAEITFCYVPAGSTASVSEVAIYREGAEWTTTASAGAIVVDSTTGPRSGTRCINGTAVAAGQYFAAVSPSPINLNTFNALILYLDPKAAWPSTRSLALRWYSGSTARGTAVSLANGSFGLNSQAGGAYQLIVIPTAMFNLPATQTADRLRVTVAGSGAAIGFLVDDVVLQAGIAESPSTGPAFRWRGTWDPAVNYAAWDAVNRSGATYLAVAASVNKSPDTSPDVWSQLGRTSMPVLVGTNLLAVTNAPGNPGETLTLSSPFDLAASNHYQGTFTGTAFSPTNAWAGPSNSVPLWLPRQRYDTWTPVHLSGVVGKSNHVTAGVLLTIRNRAATNVNLTLHPGFGGGSRSHVVTNGQVVKVSIEFDPADETNYVLRPFGF